MTYTRCTTCGAINHDTLRKSVYKEITQILSELVKEYHNQKPDKWLDMKRTCEYTSLSESTIRRGITNGNLEFTKPTGKLMFRLSWIDSFMKDK